MLSYYLVDAERLCYRVKFDDVDVGSIAKRYQHIEHRYCWHWGVDTMPLIDHAGRPPSGEANTFEEALVAFRAAFASWHAGIKPDVWKKNPDCVDHCVKRRRHRGT